MSVRSKAALSVGATIAFALLVVLFAAVTAFASVSPKISGVDCYAIENGNKIDVLMIEGNEGDTVFVEVEHGGKVIASRVPFTLAKGETTRIVNLTIDGYAPTDSYVIRAYADRANKSLLYEGTIYPVNANLGDAGTHPIATQTLSTSETRSFAPTNTLYYDGASYMLTRDSAGQPVVSTEGGLLTYAYTAYSPADVVEGSISYVDDQGTVVAKKTLPILKGSDTTYPVSSVITADNGTLYRTISYGTITPSYSGQHDFVIRVKKLTQTQVDDAYVATIKLVYVDDQGNELPLATDSVTVAGPYEYSVPSTVYATDPAGSGVTSAYTLEDASQQKLHFDRGDYDADGVTKKIRYVKTELSGRFNLINGAKRMGEEGRSLGYENFTVTQESPTAMPSQEAIEIDGVNYVLAGSASNYAYEYGSTRMPVIDVYYVPANYVAPGDYQVTVNYVNLADNSIIASKSFTSSPNQTSDLEIISDASFSEGGEEYVRLAGQELPILHNYYSGKRTYTVYYRNVNDKLNANVTVTQLRVVYEDGETVYVENSEGTQSTSSTGTGVMLYPTGEGAGADSATATGALNAMRNYNAINGGAGGYITNEEGIDSNTEHIEDEANPLASGSEGNKLVLVGSALPLGIGIGVAVVAIVVIALVMKRKNRKEREV